MKNRTRRKFLADVGKGMLAASVGPALASDLGLSAALADDAPPALPPAQLEPLVALLQETPANRLLPVLLDKLRAGTGLRTLVAAAGVANARTFGGEHYRGYHVFMALAPALEMARELPEARRPLPVLKVLYRNAETMGGRRAEVLKPVEPARPPKDRKGADLLVEAMRRRDMNGAERTFAALMEQPLGDAYDDLQHLIQEDVNVHRVVLAWRAWGMIDVAGKEFAHTLLRQSVRFCVAENTIGHKVRGVAPVLARLLDEYKLLGKPLGKRAPDDDTVAQLCRTIHSGTAHQAADAVAQALSDGLSPDDIGEAISLAANQLVLRDPGRGQPDAGKPAGSVHGDSVGVHASDAANAWRNIARVSNPRNTYASLIVGAYHTAGQSGRAGREPLPWAADLDRITAKDADGLLRQTEEAIRAGDQAHASALVHRYAEQGHAPRPVFDLLLRYAVSEDGALHAEKYYRTVTEEFAATRPAFRWRHLVALARVTTSEYGHPAPGYKEACELLKV